MPSGFSMSPSLAPQTWISSTEACTSDEQPLEVLDGEQLLAAVGIARARTMCSLMPAQACFWKKQPASTPPGQRTSASGRSTTCGAIHGQISA